MTHNAQNSLVASRDRGWRQACVARFLDRGYDVHTARDASAAIDLMRKHRYEAIAVHDSLQDMNVAELVMYVMQLSRNRPKVFVCGEQDTRLDRVCDHYRIPYKGSRSEILGAIEHVLEDDA